MNIPKAIEQYLLNRQVVSLATYSPTGGLWICTLYYAYARGELFFVSSHESRHSTAIAAGCLVAIAVADSTQTPPASAIGLQGVGFCHPASIGEFPKFLRYYAPKFPKYVAGMSISDVIAASSGKRPYIIELKSLKFTNKTLSNTPLEVGDDEGTAHPDTNVLVRGESR